MVSNFEIHLGAAEAAVRLKRLFPCFAEICNFISTSAVESKCFNRVALHHIVYTKAKAIFPYAGSQLICNAIYAVLYTYKVVYGVKNLSKLSGEGDFRKILFKDGFPVLLDMHTISLKGNTLSVYSLDGRVEVPLSLEARRLVTRNLKYIKEAFLLCKANDMRLLFICDTSQSEKSSIINKSLLDFANV